MNKEFAKHSWKKTSSQNINEKAKSNKKLELDYSQYLESIYVCNIVFGVMGTLKGI